MPDERSANRSLVAGAATNWAAFAATLAVSFFLAPYLVRSLGDARYGGALTFAGRAAPRLMLHAARLTFPHPEGGERTVEAPLPADFEALRQAAEL